MILRFFLPLGVLLGVAAAAALWLPDVLEPRRPPPPEPEAAGSAVGTGDPAAVEGPSTPRLRPPDPEPEKAEPLPSLAEARSWRDMGNASQAVDRLDRILAREPGNVDALAMRGLAHLDLGMNRLAETDLRAALAGADPTPERLEGLAVAVQTRSPLEAIDLCTRSAALEPTRARPHALIARIQFRIGRRAEAAEAASRALAIDPADPVALAVEERLRMSR